MNRQSDWDVFMAECKAGRANARDLYDTPAGRTNAEAIRVTKYNNGDYPFGRYTLENAYQVYKKQALGLRGVEKKQAERYHYIRERARLRESLLYRFSAKLCYCNGDSQPWIMSPLMQRLGIQYSRGN